MPHRVASFLPFSSSNISQIKNAARSRTASRNASCESSRNNSVSGGSPAYDSESDDQQAAAIKTHDLIEAVKRHHKLSLPSFGRSASPVAARELNPASCSVAAVDWSIESPPIIFHGTREDSTGAIVSGQLFLDIKDDAVDIDSFKATLAIHTTYKRPCQGHCAECQNKVVELQAWTLLDHTTRLHRGQHAFPFSALLSGDLPASTNTPLVSIAYEFKAVAQVARASTGTSVPIQLKFDRTLLVKRSVPEPLFPHHSVRVFPPTNIKASADYLSVIHPTSTNKLTLKLDGLMTHNEKVKTVDLWKLKKVTWRLEETIKTVALACDRHAASASTCGGGVRGTFRNETRVIGEKSLQEGWKSDYTGHDGSVDMEIDYAVSQARSSVGELKYACDAKTADGTEVSHTLLLELIVSKEYAPEGKAHQATPTGTGRILRMHFAVVVTEHSGLGVSWDNEAPPIYEDVPPSPPAYPLESPVDYQDLEPLYARPSSIDASAEVSDEEAS
ncbi:hypothetical protein PWT90_07072 [Aphanocladium album]|nr:hypothetical protein PWT90_07072 [Aphanocladium album]